MGVRLTGYACKHHEPPARQAFLPLDELCVVLGPNDTGKSTLLRSLVRDLQGGHFGRDSDAEHLIGGVFYAEVSDHELHRLTVAASGRGDGHLEGARSPFRGGLWSADLSQTDLEPNGPDAVISHLAATQPQQWAASILKALGGSRTVGLECAGMNGIGRRVWNVYWCVDPIARLDDDVADGLRASDLAPFSPTKGVRRGIYEAIHGHPFHLCAQGAPIAVVSLGAATGISMPQGLAVPVESETLRTSVSDAITFAVNVWRHAYEDAPRDGERLSAAEEDARRAPRAWLEENDAWVGLSWEAIAVCDFISTAANRLLPEFVASRYRIGVELRDIDEWFTSEPLRLMAWRPSDDAPEYFPIERVADGFVLWVQLAVLRALDEIRSVASLMRTLVSRSYDAERSARLPLGEPDRAAGMEAGAEFRRRFDEMANEIRLVDIESGLWVSEKLQRDLDALADDSSAGEVPGARRVLVVDEPERHLHPRLQRQAASWLAETAGAKRSTLLLATHSPAFLSLPGSEATYVSITRTGDEVRAQTFDPADVEQLDELAQSMGYDRGELVSLVRVWLVVEGVTDKSVFDELYGSALRREGIEVVPLHGTARWQTLLDADALWRFTGAPVAVMFDGVDADTITKLEESSAVDLEVVARSSKERDAITALARLIRNLRRIGRRIHPLPFEPADMLLALDEVAVTTVFPKYPGHEAASKAWQRHRKGSHDAFLRTRYQVEKDPEKFREIASVMVHAGATSAALERVFEACRALAYDLV